jgi:murein DD-endopeptidase MepM/ murein hydrolase activator NlpD
MSQIIFQPVGDWAKGAKNLYKDVFSIQELLETASVVLKKPDIDPQGVDGKISRPPRSSNTVRAIVAFQKLLFGQSDGLVEPKNRTLKKLHSYDKLGERNISKPPTIPTSGLYFPLAVVPQRTYQSGSTRFGARRSKGTRKHAGCDLIATEGTKIYAIDDGTIIRGPYPFYRGTYAIEVKHTRFVARYCEIKGVVSGLKKGSVIKGGQLIAYVGRMHHSSMLHFELYQGSNTGPLTQRSNTPYQRREDLLDPTPYLGEWERNLPREIGAN